MLGCSRLGTNTKTDRPGRERPGLHAEARRSLHEELVEDHADADEHPELVQARAAVRRFIEEHSPIVHGAENSPPVASNEVHTAAGLQDEVSGRVSLVDAANVTARVKDAG